MGWAIIECPCCGARMELGKHISMQTNADRIRSMTDEELATYYFTEFFGKVPYCHENCPAHDDCQLCLLDWLRQECE